MFFSGFISRQYFYPPEPEIKWKTRVQTDIVYRDYPTVSLPECIDKLKCYDTALPRLEYERIDAGTYRIGAGLCGREWTRDLSIEVGEGGNWKFYVGGGIAAAGIIGILVASKVVR